MARAECSECHNEYSKEDLRPYKYENRLVCDDCESRLMTEEEPE